MMAQHQSANRGATFIEIVPARAHHIGELRDNLRLMDAEEILRFGVSVERGLWNSYRQSTYRYSIFIDGKIAAMFGAYGGFFGREATIWLMTTDQVYKISALRFVKIYQEEVYKMLNIFPRLENYVLADYTAAVRLLDIIGFKMGEPEPYGSRGEMYRKFWIGK